MNLCDCCGKKESNGYSIYCDGCESDYNKMMAYEEAMAEEAKCFVIDRLFNDCEYPTMPARLYTPDDDIVNGDELLILENEITICVKYPVRVEYLYGVNNSGGWTRLQLFHVIKEAYEHVYADAETFKVWGHDMDDLRIEKVEYFNGLVTLKMGS